MEHVVANAVARCPFLHRVKEQEGEAFAARIAVNPFTPAACPATPRRPLLEELEDYQLTFKLMHGEGGAVPLRLGERNQQGTSSQGDRGHASATVPEGQGPPPKACPAHATLLPPSAPFATMSLSFGAGMPDFGRILKALQQHNQHMRKTSQQQHKPQAQRGQSGPAELRKPAQPTNGSSASSPSPGSTASNAAGSGGQCPMRKLLGPLAPLVFNPKGHLQCPEPIIRARAALAATKPVRELRPQALPVKLAAVGAIAAAFNVPCGMAREHTDKFSWQWFLAVHASIPFIAMLRKAVIMPKYAIVFTIAAAIAGQAMGAKMERKRLGRARSSSHGDISTDTALKPAAAPVAATTAVRATHRDDAAKGPGRPVSIPMALSISAGTGSSHSYNSLLGAGWAGDGDSLPAELGRDMPSHHSLPAAAVVRVRS